MPTQTAIQLDRRLPGSLCACLLAIACMTIVAGCSGGPGDSYADQYLAALENQVGITAQQAHFAPFENFITHIGSDDWEQRFDGVYASDVHFSDTLVVIPDRATLKTYFADLHEGGASVSVNVLARQQNGQDAYVVWEMQSTFKPVFTAKQSHTIGVTHLRFNEAGEVILHQDFWDAATGFYQHVPVLGSAVRGIRARLQP